MLKWKKHYLDKWLCFQPSIMSLRGFLRHSWRRTFRKSFVISCQLIEDIMAVKLYCLLWRSGRKVVLKRSSLLVTMDFFSLINFLSRSCKHTALIIWAALFFWTIFRIGYSRLRSKTLCRHWSSQVERYHEAAFYIMYFSMTWPNL